MKWKRYASLGGCIIAAACLLVAGPVHSAATEAETAERDARAAMDAFMKAFNAGDNDALQAVMNYPHVFVGANGGIRVIDDRLDMDFDRLRNDEGWHHSTMDSADAFLVKEDKVHFNIVFSRHKADGTTYQTTPGLWIMTKQDGNWGLSVRSY
jgi:ketosteroid isomerase-like protein